MLIRPKNWPTKMTKWNRNHWKLSECIQLQIQTYFEMYLLWYFCVRLVYKFDGINVKYGLKQYWQASEWYLPDAKLPFAQCIQHYFGFRKTCCFFLKPMMKSIFVCPYGDTSINCRQEIHAHKRQTKKGFFYSLLENWYWFGTQFNSW